MQSVYGTMDRVIVQSYTIHGNQMLVAGSRQTFASLRRSKRMAPTQVSSSDRENTSNHLSEQESRLLRRFHHSPDQPSELESLRFVSQPFVCKDIDSSL